MTEPTFTAATEDTYASLATYLRVADRDTWPLKRFLAPMLDQLGAVLDLYEQADYISPDEFGADTRALTFYTNLALNPSYEDADPLPPNNPTNATIDRVQANASGRDGGDYAWQFTALADGMFGGRVNQDGADVGGSSHAMPVSSGHVTTSLDVWAVPGRTIRFEAVSWDAAGASLPAPTVDVPYTGPGYQRLMVTHTLPAGTAAVNVRCYVVEGVAGEEFLVDCLLVIDGTQDYPYRRYNGVATGETSELATPEIARDEWLPWLAQLVGVRLNLALTRDAKVDAIRYASAGWQGGTKAAVAAAAKSVLTGTKYVQVYDHSTAAGIGTGGEWDVLLITRATETPDVSAVLDAVIAQNAKPAGVVLHHVAYNATWAQIQAAYPTWADWRTAGTWQRIEEAGL